MSELDPCRSDVRPQYFHIELGSELQSAISALSAGRLIIVVNDDDPDNEANLVASASAVTPAQMAFVISHTSGIVCVPMTAQRCSDLGLYQMSAENKWGGRSFTISVDHQQVVTGVSASDRARTVRALADPTTDPRDFRRPGHVFPLEARRGGTLERPGHTEAAIDLLRLAGLPDVAVLCELIGEDGEVLRSESVLRFADRHGMPVVHIADVIAYRKQSERLVERVGSTRLPTAHGTFMAVAYRTVGDGSEHLALVMGGLDAIDAKGDVPTYLHRECLVGDILRAQSCSCRVELDHAMRTIASAGRGVLVYLRGNEGNTIDLAHGRSSEAVTALPNPSSSPHPHRSEESYVFSQVLADLGIALDRGAPNPG